MKNKIYAKDSNQKIKTRTTKLIPANWGYCCSQKNLLEKHPLYPCHEANENIGPYHEGYNYKKPLYHFHLGFV